MAQRKIKLTMSSNLLNEIGPIVDIEFDNEVLDQDLEIDVEYGSGTVVREYTVDKSAGEYNLNFTFKNDDMGPDNIIDRNFILETIEVSNDGVAYSLPESGTVVYVEKTFVDESTGEEVVEQVPDHYEEFDYQAFESLNYGPYMLTDGSTPFPLAIYYNRTVSYKIIFS